MEITTVEEEKKKEVKATKPTIKKEEKPKVPMGYVRVRLDSLGKLSAPFELHFRDYSIEEVMELASTTEDIDNLATMITILNNMIFEDFDCGDLTLSELLEIVYTLQGAFYSQDIEKKVILDEDGDKEDEDNYVYALIPLNRIPTKTLAEEFREPFTLSDPKTKMKVSFRLPRIKDKITAENYLRDKYKKEIREFSEIYYLIQQIEKIKNTDLRVERMHELEDSRADEMQKFRAYLIEKAKILLVLTQGLSIVSINDEKLEYGDCEKLLEIMPSISRRIWEKYTQTTDKYKFGLQDEVTFYLPELKKDVTRRLPHLRTMDFLPDNEQKIDTGIDLSFD